MYPQNTQGYVGNECLRCADRLQGCTQEQGVSAELEGADTLLETLGVWVSRGWTVQCEVAVLFCGSSPSTDRIMCSPVGTLLVVQTEMEMGQG